MEPQPPIKSMFYSLRDSPSLTRKFMDIYVNYVYIASTSTVFKIHEMQTQTNKKKIGVFNFEGMVP